MPTSTLRLATTRTSFCAGSKPSPPWSRGWRLQTRFAWKQRIALEIEGSAIPSWAPSCRRDRITATNNDAHFIALYRNKARRLIDALASEREAVKRLRDEVQFHNELRQDTHQRGLNLLAAELEAHSITVGERDVLKAENDLLRTMQKCSTPDGEVERLKAELAQVREELSRTERDFDDVWKSRDEVIRHKNAVLERAERAELERDEARAELAKQAALRSEAEERIERLKGELAKANRRLEIARGAKPWEV